MKNYLSKLFIVLMLLLCCMNVQAEEMYVGVPYSSSGYFPYYSNPYSGTKYLIHKDELNNQAMTINNMAFLIYSVVGGGGTTEGVSIYVKETTDSLLSTSDPTTTAGYDLVWQGDVSIESDAVGTWQVFNFAQPFTYSGTKHLSFIIRRDNGVQATSYYNYYSTYTNGRGSAMGRYYYGAVVPATYTTTLLYRPYTCFNYDISKGTTYQPPLISVIDEIDYCNIVKRYLTASSSGSTSVFYIQYPTGGLEARYPHSLLGDEARDISTISFYTYSRTGTAGNKSNSIRIYLKNTDDNTAFVAGNIDSSAASGYTKVFDGPYTLSNSAALEWIDFKLENPFHYDGKSNLQILIASNTGVSLAQYHTFMLFYSYGDNGVNYNARYSYTTTAGGTLTNSAYSYSPMARFKYIEEPKVQNVYPDSLLFGAGAKKGDIIIPYLQIDRKEEMPPVKVQYQVLGPDGNMVYEALDPYTNSNWVDVPDDAYTTGVKPDFVYYTQYFRKAQGVLADVSNPDTAKISFRSDKAKAGEYKVAYAMSYEDKPGEYRYKYDTAAFNVVYNYDIALDDVSSPQSYSSTGEIYPIANSPIRITVAANNAGYDDINNYSIKYTVEHVDATTQARTVVYGPTIVPTVMLNAIKPGATKVTDFDGWIPATLLPGTYYLTVELILVGEKDSDTTNNSNLNNKRDVNLESPFDGIMEAILVPHDPTSDDSTESYAYNKQPMLPKVKVKNVGGYAASEVPITVTISNTSGTVYTATELIDLLDSKYSTTDMDERVYEFLTPYIPSTSGTYTVIATIDGMGMDPNMNNNSLTADFTVQPSLSGTHTIGASKEYSDIAAALADVYKKGVNGTLTFELSDAVVNVGDIDSIYALDFSSAIAGFGATDLIRFVPSKELGRYRGGVTLRLNSNSGMGMRFGASLTSQFPDAPVNRIKYQAKRAYYPFNARVEFDGGANQAIRFITGDVPTAQTNNVLLYLTEGASNITVENCILEGRATNSTTIPLALWNREKNNFTYDAVENLSSCILLRALPPQGEIAKSYKLDTLVNKNIVIQNNYIESGAYGIVSLGIGALYNSGVGKFQRYYNDNNSFTNNQMINQTRAGIFMGYEENSSAAFNRIFYIGQNGLTDKETAGIILGGEADADHFGYNNIGVTLNGNEISSVKSKKDVYGIKIEQNRNNFPDMHIQPDGKHPYVPNVPDKLNIFNNLVWDITSGSNNGSKYGIRMFTTRDTSKLYDPFIYFATPKEAIYSILGSKIINNSVVISDDNANNGSSAFIAGITVQNVDSMEFYNNAINLLDVSASSDVVAPLVLESVRPGLCDIAMNNNVYYNAAGGNALVRFIEQSGKDNTILNYGYRNEFITLDQWQFWGNSDTESSVYNFKNDVYITGSTIPKMRVSSPVPVGSYLNNRGKVMPIVTTDIDHNPRGSADQGYDIGSWEFDGLLYANDLEVFGFITPVSYKDNLPNSPFNDAEYVMTTNPIAVQVNIRNNGSVFAANKPVQLTVTCAETGESFTFTEYLTIGAFETKVLDFKTNIDGANKFEATSYAKIKAKDANFVIPDRFATMQNNVTPIYKFEVMLPTDENNDNNVNPNEKIVRFYVKNSNLHLLISAENTTFIAGTVEDYYDYIANNVDVTTAADYEKVAGFCNYKALRLAFDTLGYTNSDDGYDLFDRTNWQPRSVDYTAYKSIFWADGLNSIFTEYQEENIDAFLALATIDIKRNLIISSQELSRNSYAAYTQLKEEDYFKNLFNLKPLGTGVRLPEFVNGFDWITGAGEVAEGETSFQNTPLVSIGKDYSPLTGIFEITGSSVRNVRQAFFYTKPVDVVKSQKTMGTASYSSKDILCYLGIDWRNYSKPSFILNSIIDFIKEQKGSIIPIELLSFDAYIINNKVHLNWETATEISANDKFTVEKLDISHANAGLNNFFVIDEVKAKGVSSEYTSIDANVKFGGKYIYRLKYIDLNGDFSCSEERIVSINESGNFIILNEINPNPVNEILNISFSLSTDMNVKLAIYDVNGNEIAIINDTYFDANTHKLSFNVSDIASGTYSLILFTNDNSVAQPFTIVK